MTSAAQLLLAVVICILTFLITFAAIQTFYLLHDLRAVVKKINQIIDKPGNDTAIRQVLQLSQNDDRVINNFPEEISPPNRPSGFPRFFKRSGSPLRS